MKKIIKGKKYDTETATKVFEKEWEDYRQSCYQTFYLKKTGEWFCYFDTIGTYGIGRSRYLQPMGIDEVKKLAEVILDGDKYEEIFGEVEE